MIVCREAEFSIDYFALVALLKKSCLQKAKLKAVLYDTVSLL